MKTWMKEIGCLKMAEDYRGKMPRKRKHDEHILVNAGLSIQRLYEYISA